MTKVKALNRDGKITWCTAKNPGTGTCNHICHKTENISDEEFQQHVDRYNERMNRLLYSNKAGDRMLCAGQGYGLDILVNDYEDAAKEAVAHFGRDKDLDKLHYDKADRVRIFVAAKGRPQDRDLFLKDHSWVARKTYVENCRNREDVRLFLNDDDESVREEAQIRLSD